MIVYVKIEHETICYVTLVMKHLECCICQAWLVFLEKHVETAKTRALVLSALLSETVRTTSLRNLVREGMSCVTLAESEKLRMAAAN